MEDYSKDYHTCTEEAAQEIKVNARPELTQYTVKLASDNGVEYDEAEERTGNAVADFESYFSVQKKCSSRRHEIMPHCRQGGI